MRSTIDIKDSLLKEAMSLTRARTKKELVDLSLRTLIQERRRERLRNKLGKFSLSLNLESLERLRRDE